MCKNARAKDEQLQRVACMEDIFDRVSEALEKLSLAAREYEALKPELQKLEEYYQNGRWMCDFFAERKDAFPKDMKRGILTEDAIYDLLTDIESVKARLKDVL